MSYLWQWNSCPLPLLLWHRKRHFGVAGANGKRHLVYSSQTAYQCGLRARGGRVEQAGGLLRLGSGGSFQWQCIFQARHASFHSLDLRQKIAGVVPRRHFSNRLPTKRYILMFLLNAPRLSGYHLIIACSMCPVGAPCNGLDARLDRIVWMINV